MHQSPQEEMKFDDGVQNETSDSQEESEEEVVERIGVQFEESDNSRSQARNTIEHLMNQPKGVSNAKFRNKDFKLKNKRML